MTSAPGLLPMLCKPSELEEEVGLSVRSIREWLDLGLPHERDAQGHIWINGTEFSKWVETTRCRQRGTGLDDDEAYCLKCRRPVPLVVPVRRESGAKVFWTALARFVEQQSIEEAAVCQ